MKNKNRIREGSRIATVIMYTLSIFVVLVTLYPMYYVLILSVSDPMWALTMQVYVFPKGFNFESYKILVSNRAIWRAFANTVMYAGVTTVLMLIVSFLAAYPLTSKTLAGRKYINIYLLVTMFFSGGLIPSFLLMMKLHIYNTPLALIVPACFSVWNVILLKAYLSTIPETLREAAKIDGATVYQTMGRIYLPLSTPILAVIAVYTVVGAWNSWFSALVYLPDINWQPLQLFLRRMLILVQNPGTLMSQEEVERMAALRITYAQLKYAMIIFSSLPVLFTYPFFQKYFIKGIMLGSLKE
jgi:putative aldouronate transport system permease protein